MSITITRPIRLVCTGRGTHQVVELAVLVPVTGRPRLALADVSPGGPPPDEARGFGVEGSLSERAAGFQAPRQQAKSDAWIEDAKGGPVLHLQQCPHCWASSRRSRKGQTKRDRGEGHRISVRRIVDVADYL